MGGVKDFHEHGARFLRNLELAEAVIAATVGRSSKLSLPSPRVCFRCFPIGKLARTALCSHAFILLQFQSLFMCPMPSDRIRKPKAFVFLKLPPVANHPRFHSKAPQKAPEDRRSPKPSVVAAEVTRRSS